MTAGPKARTGLREPDSVRCGQRLGGTGLRKLEDDGGRGKKGRTRKARKRQLTSSPEGSGEQTDPVGDADTEVSEVGGPTTLSREEETERRRKEKSVSISFDDFLL